MDSKSLSAVLDLANHHANATQKDVEQLAEQVKVHGFNAVFVNPCYVQFAKNLKVKVGTVVSFPLGQDSLNIKLASARESAAQGADELDVSLHVGLIKEAKWDQLLNEMERIVSTVKQINDQKIVKFILETGYLTEDEIKKGSELIVKSGADFVKTNSGMGPRGVEVKDVEIIKQAVGDQIRIKAAGGVDTYNEAIALINAGVNRIGTSKAVEIISGIVSQTNQS